MKFDKIEILIQKVDTIIRSEIWVALMIIYQAVLFLFFTDMAFTGTAFGIVIPVGILALSVLVEYITTRKLFKRENMKPLCMALFFGILAIFVMLHPKKLSVVFHYGLAAMLVVDGILGILSILHFQKIQKNVTLIKMKGKERRERSSVKEYDDAIIVGMKDQKSFMLKPLEILRKKSEQYAGLSFVMEIVTISIGVILMLYHDSFGHRILRISGVCLLIIGMKDLVMGLRAARLNKRGQTSL